MSEDHEEVGKCEAFITIMDGKMQKEKKAQKGKSRRGEMDPKHW